MVPPQLASADLAAELFAEGDYAACAIECRRAATAPDPGPANLHSAGTSAALQAGPLLQAMAELEMGTNYPAAADFIGSTTDAPAELHCSALWVSARSHGQHGNTRRALKDFTTVFHTTTNHTLFLRSACSIYLLMQDDPALREEQAALLQQVNSTRGVWRGDLFATCRIAPAPRSSFWSIPGEWGIACYRHWIRPAIGSRCRLTPSCSEYTRLAFRQHGLLALPMFADRLCREPSVFQRKAHPVGSGPELRFADPLEAHTFWFAQPHEPTDGNRKETSP